MLTKPKASLNYVDVVTLPIPFEMETVPLPLMVITGSKDAQVKTFDSHTTIVVRQRDIRGVKCRLGGKISHLRVIVTCKDAYETLWKPNQNLSNHAKDKVSIFHENSRGSILLERVLEPVEETLQGL